MKRLLFTVLMLGISIPALADQVIGIADGDTLTVLHGQKPLRIRLADIDAPEKKQAFGERSKQSLSDLCFGKDATYKAKMIDPYGRTVARVKCVGADVNRIQVERGLAWVYDQYNTDRSLPALQASAKAEHRGLWADKSPVPPWEYRHPMTTAANNDPTCHVGPRGGHYRIVHGHKRYDC